jgi:hypothetical protein
MEGITLNIGSPNPINMLIETNDCVFIVSRRAPFGAALAGFIALLERDSKAAAALYTSL